jgi:hypothetical protein
MGQIFWIAPAPAHSAKNDLAELALGCDRMVELLGHIRGVWLICSLMKARCDSIDQSFSGGLHR